MPYLLPPPVALVDSERTTGLEAQYRYFENKQYEDRQYSWDGRFNGYGEEADIRPGFVVPYAGRKPSVTVGMGKTIVGKLTAMMLGESGWPEVKFEDDVDATDYAKALCKEAKLKQKFSEIRNFGGGEGSACVSFSFVKGKPKISIHNPAHICILEWEDKDNFRPKVVLEVYRYQKKYYEEGKEKLRTCYYAQYWDEIRSIVWEEIPKELEKDENWSTLVEGTVVEHGYDECPVYWCQNKPCSNSIDGLGDYDGLEGNFDQINYLMSSTTKGTIANVDPTLIIMDDPVKGKGGIQKGSGQAIFAKGGAKYLELSGDAAKSGREQARDIARYCFDEAGVVVPDQDTAKSAAKSAAALKMLYAPMCNECDVLRTQYGTLLEQLILGMVRAARMIKSTPAVDPMEIGGELVEVQPTVVLPPKVEQDGDSIKTTERVPGTSEFISLQWGEYFLPTQDDISKSTDTAIKAKGTLVSDETATKHVASYFGVEDVVAERAKIDKETEARAAMFPGPLDIDGPPIPPTGPNSNEDTDEDDDDGE